MSAPQCRGCKAIIRWITTEAGKNAPVDPEKLQAWVTDTPRHGAPVGLPRITLIDGEGKTHHGYQASVVTEGARLIEGYVPHFSTCPHARRFKR